MKRDETIGDRLKLLRKAYGFNQTQIAEYLGFRQSQIAKLESNQRRLNVESVEKLARLYNVTENYIIHGGNGGLKPDFKFISHVKKLNLDNIVEMNKIMHNIDFLNDRL